MENLNQICAFIDAQGFEDGTFKPVELAVVNSKVAKSFTISNNFKFDSVKDFQSACYARDHIHGLTLISGCKDSVHFDNLKLLLTQLYKELGSVEKLFFGCKNNQLRDLLRIFHIPVIDLSDRIFEAPSLEKLDQGKSVWFCPLHKNLPKDRQKFRCANRKAQRFWEWLENKQLVFRLVKECSFSKHDMFGNE
jgi:hypothetical protein